MGIEQWHLNHTPENPAYRLLMGLIEWCQEQGLAPETVKIIHQIGEVPQCTALGAKMNISPKFSRLTPQERNLVETGEIFNIPTLLIVDVDGVLVSIWPAIVNFWEKWKASPTFSPSQVWKNLEESIVQTRPPWWDTLLPLARIVKVADEVIIWTNRLPVNQDSILWKIVYGIFDDGTWLERFPFFSNQAAERLEKVKPFQGKTRVLCGFPKRLSPIIQEIEASDDPYVVYAGSSLPDINSFKRIIRKLRQRELPFHRVVFCSTNHLLL